MKLPINIKSKIINFRWNRFRPWYWCS